MKKIKPLNEFDAILEKWSGKLQKQYTNLEEFEAYDSIYNLASRLGYKNAKEAWEDNPTVTGSTNPAEYKVADKGKLAVGRNGLFKKA